MDIGANMNTFADKWMFTRYEERLEPSFVITTCGQRLLILGKRDIGNLFGVVKISYL